MIQLDESPAMVTVGASLFADALTAQVATPRQVQWAPPVPGSEADLAAIAGDVRTHAATAESVRRLTAASPQWVDVLPAREALGLGPREFLHAGPPVDWARRLRSDPWGAGRRHDLRGAGRELRGGRADRSAGWHLARALPLALGGRPDGRCGERLDAGVGARGRGERSAGVLHLERGSREGPTVRGLLARGHRPPSLAGAGARPSAGHNPPPAGARRRAQPHRPSPADGRRVPQPQPCRHLAVVAGDHARHARERTPAARTSWRRSGSSTATTTSSSTSPCRPARSPPTPAATSRDPPWWWRWPATGPSSASRSPGPATSGSRPRHRR